MNAKVDISGERFGRWVALRRGVPSRKWLCRCDCGTEKLVAGPSLRAGGSLSCGCLVMDINTRHGHNRKPGGVRDKSSAYSRWSAMQQRCANPKHKQYADYGGRGISVCDRWRDFALFLADMGEPPEGMTLDRIDNALGYEPANCRWATRTEQQMNRRNNRVIECRGRVLPLTAWAREAGIKPESLRHRLRAGWPVERAIFQPVA